MMPGAALPDISGNWTSLDTAAEDLRVRARVAESYLTDAANAWNRVIPAYREPGTQDLVHTAMDSLAAPMAAWRSALVTAAGIIQDFAAAAGILGSEYRTLEAERPSSDPAEDDPSAQRALDDFNSRARDLTQKWNSLQQETAARLAAISGGTGEGIPMLAPSGGPVLPEVDWAALTVTLDHRLGAVTSAQLFESLRGLDTAELQAWTAANPEAAALLAANRLTGPFPEESPEATMSTLLQDSLSPEGIAAIRTAWLQLPAADREKLLLLYPAVFGSLNGVPFASRVHANTITVAGSRQAVKQELATLEEPKLTDYGYDRAAATQWHHDHTAWEAEQDSLQRLLKGLDYAVAQGTQVVMVSTEGDGRIVTMQGTPSDTVTRSAVLVPGTGADLGSLAGYLDRLDAVEGKPEPQKVSFYWQGTDLPNELHHNLTASYNENGGPLLAAFDHALDLEVPQDTRSTYIGYSAGGSLLGTAEREGLTASNILYVAPAGTGHEVSSPGDTASPNSNRYWIQTRDDPISVAQIGGGGFHSGSFWSGGNPHTQMGAVRLESGFVDPKKPDSLMRGHTDYFAEGSTSAANIQSVINGNRVSLYVEDEFHYGFGYAYSESPIEERPEDYANMKLQTVTTESLEK
ncbi:hypothetical protein ITX31_05785 [Arthrobacter gandavensis]|uniref:hypothetical protein n=1 Tax=Arthrobacter gandavensis TaxID=169960 RepID=UPI001E3BAA5B|nr:hypothetical protein [Arthrobacter gandavensis]MBF4993619.1 hypothetical protein [Arthrobacter gandavensis]